LLCGEKLFGGRYEVIAELAAGGQAIVYEALDFGGNGGSKSVPRNVVLKEFVLPAHAGVSVRGRVLENIQREAKLLKSLKHPNIVKLLDFFVDDERAYLVLERIRGSNLKQLVEDKGALEEGQVVMFALQMCEILGYLHANNVVHRDFTPDNLILGHGDILKLIDFNVARQRENDSTKTVVGKHSYIPPEQFRGKAVPQSDLYAAGGTLHFLLTGLEPEPITSSQPRQFNAAISVELNRIVSKATALELGHRYPSCVELRADIQALKARYFDEI
jgi:serine/threonine-protein kinase